MKRLHLEALVHFLLFGALLFAVYAWLEPTRGRVEPSKQIPLTLDDLSPSSSEWPAASDCTLPML